jgi:hypothetical protein
MIAIMLDNRDVSSDYEDTTLTSYYTGEAEVIVNHPYWDQYDGDGDWGFIPIWPMTVTILIGGTPAYLTTTGDDMGVIG